MHLDAEGALDRAVSNLPDCAMNDVYANLTEAITKVRARMRAQITP